MSWRVKNAATVARREEEICTRERKRCAREDRERGREGEEGSGKWGSEVEDGRRALYQNSEKIGEIE